MTQHLRAWWSGPFGRPMGLARHGHYLDLGWGHGFGCGWAPYPLLSWVQDWWNDWACHRWGHDWAPSLGRRPDGTLGLTYEVCTACCATRDRD